MIVFYRIKNFASEIEYRANTEKKDNKKQIKTARLICHIQFASGPSVIVQDKTASVSRKLFPGFAPYNSSGTTQTKNMSQRQVSISLG